MTEGVRTFEAARLDRVRTVVEINREAALSRHAGASNAERLFASQFLFFFPAELFPP